MPASLDRTDRTILIGAVLLVFVLAIATALLTPSKQRGRSGYPSSYATQWDGAKAAYLVLESLGYDIQRWNESPTALEADDAKDQVLILANPIQPPTTEETAALREFLQRGGQILATGEQAAEFLPDAERFDENDDVEEISFKALIPSPLTAGAKEISMTPPYYWRPHAINQIVAYGNHDTAAVVTYSVGEGRVIWWGSPSPLTNRGIKEADNLILLLNSVGTSDRKILWDEYYHGARGDLWSYLRKTPLPWVCVQIGFGLLLIFFTYSRRYGTTRMPGKFSRLAPLEFVDTLGSLYKTAHAGSAAARVAYHRLRFQITRQLGLSGNAVPGEIAKAAGPALGWDETALLGALLRADRGSRTVGLSDAEALEIVQELHDYTVRLETRRMPDEKGKPK
jgi:hypothetical protein